MIQTWGVGNRELPDSDGSWTPDWAEVGQQESCKEGLVLVLLQGNWQPICKLCKLSLTLWNV